jgi:ABC-type branched-subunit amino acid transport system ATPase component
VIAGPALAASDLTASRGGAPILDGISLTVDPGEAVFLAGNNGAGRSTLIGALAGLIPSRGRVVVGGRVVPRGRSAAAVRAGLVAVPERRQLFPGMTVEENLVLGLYTGRTWSVRAARRAPAIEDVYGRFPALRSRRSQRAGTLSGGEQQMLALGRALVSAPTVLLLDEPFLGLAPAVANGLMASLAGLRDGGRALIVVDDHAGRVAALADRVVTLERGRVVIPG